jgi:hypothetical protein
MISSEFMFKKETLNSFHVLEEPGTYFVKCNNRITQQHFYKEDDHPRYIVNLKVIYKDNIEKCLGLFGAREEIPFRLIKPYIFTGVIWENQVLSVLDLPNKNEEVIVTFSLIDDVIKCTSLTLVPRKKLSTLELDQVCKSRKLLNEILKSENEKL